VRDRIAHGTTTAIVPTGGVEQGGPHLALGKHNAIVAATSEAIARELGNALVAPVIPISPAGSIDPPSGHMTKAGSLTWSDEVFGAVLEETARSLAVHGFKAICFVGDHGWAQGPQARIAAKLSAEWRERGIRVVQVSDYYDDANGQYAWLRFQGERDAAIGSHAGIRDTSELMVVEPSGVRADELGAAVPEGSGVVGDPSRASAERGRHLLDLKVAAAVKQIRAALTR
jgi:creatinine amidohydrolase/Fe(II)-dependent formamide hydrolase-like protein